MQVTLTRMGLFPPGVQLFNGEAKRAQVAAALGPGGHTTVFTPQQPCENHVGEVWENVARAVRWGDMLVSFDATGTMVGYLYSSRGHGTPIGTYRTNVTLGTPMSTVITDPAVLFPSGEYVHGWRWTVRGQAPGLLGFADGPTPQAHVSSIYVGAACFGVAD